MSEPNKQNPSTPRRSKRKPAMEPLGWDEIVSQPGMGGYLSFLNGPVPLPHLQGPAPRVLTDPGIISGPARESASGIAITTGVESSPDVISSTLSPEVGSTPGAAAVRAVVAPPVVQSTSRLRIRKCMNAHDGHSLGEEVLYQALWKAGSSESAETRTIVIGWRGMSQLCRMTPKNCKINTQRLMRKFALEVLSPYNTPESIGTTYRIYSDEAILRRRREQGFEWVVRSRGVEFVDPGTGISLLPD